MEFIDKMISGLDISYKDLEKGNVKLPVNRTLYLNQLLKTVSNTQITKNAENKQLVNGLDKENGFTEKQAEYLRKDIKDN